MDFQKFEMIVETIALFWVICCVVIWFIHRKKKEATAGKLKKGMIYISIIVFAGYFMSNLVKCLFKVPYTISVLTKQNTDMF